MSPRVSVVMPVRDAAPWLAEARSALTAQTERDWELLAVDDGSRNRSRAMLERWARADTRVRVLETRPAKSGIVAALNSGLSASRASLIARMDADDLSSPERLALQCRALDRSPSLFCSTCCVEAFPSGSVRDGMRRYFAWQNSLADHAAMARDRFVETPILHPTIVMRAGVLRGVLGGWRECGWPEDWDLFLRAFEKGLTFERVSRVLVRWRLHPGQASRTYARYSEDSFRAARAHFLARALARVAGPVWLLGAGPVGKSLAKCLSLEGAPIAGFAEIDARKIGGVVRGAHARWPVIAMQELLAYRPKPRAVAAVGRAGARERIRALLQDAGWEEGKDFFVAA